MKTLSFMILFLGLAGLSMGAADKDKSPKNGAEAAVIKIARAYEAAFNKGDAKALGAIFAEDVEYTDEDGVLTEGRAAVEALLKKGFVLNPGAKMSIDVQSVRNLTPDVAVERGVTLTTSRQGEKDSSAYTAVHVRKDGQWHIKQLVESPVPAPSPGEMLSELAWMVGTWKEKDGDAEIETKVNWAKGGNFITRNFKVSVKGSESLQGWQIIGWDAANENIRSWLFDTEGGFLEGTWTRSGNSWVIKQTGTLPDGGTLASESTMQRVGDNECSWETTNRTLDGDPQPNLPRIKIVRVVEK